MKKTVKIILGLLIAILFIIVLQYFKKANSKSVVSFKLEEPYYSSIKTKIVATGELNPEEEIELKPQVSGIVDKVIVEEGDYINKGDLIAKIRVVPNEQILLNAKSRINSTKLVYDNEKIQYDRNKALYERGAITKQNFEASQLSLSQAKEVLNQAKNDYQIIKKGTLSLGGAANTNVIAQISGTILDIPIREGDQVIQSNNFNEGTTIATIANMKAMIFEGKVDESEVSKLKEGKEIKVIIGAIDDQEFLAKLIFIAPKGIKDNGAVQFLIKATVNVGSSTDVRAGFSANAEVELKSKDSVLCIKEKLLQFDEVTNKPFVERKLKDGGFEKVNIKLGLSNGVDVEVLGGVKKGDQIKNWNTF